MAVEEPAQSHPQAGSQRVARAPLRYSSVAPPFHFRYICVAHALHIASLRLGHPTETRTESRFPGNVLPLSFCHSLLLQRRLILDLPAEAGCS